MKNNMSTLKYLLLTLRHKYFVFKYGLRLKVPIVSLVVHDYTKLYPQNLISYGRQFFGDQGDPVGFAYTWNHHQKRHRHHWEYWIMVTGHNRGGFGDGHILDMPDKYIREMAADWLAASRVYSNEEVKFLHEWTWLHQNFSKMRLSDYTRTRVLDLLNFYFEEHYENFNSGEKKSKQQP